MVPVASETRCEAAALAVGGPSVLLGHGLAGMMKHQNMASTHTSVSAEELQYTTPRSRLLITRTSQRREFPKIRGTLFWGPYHKDPTNYLGYYNRVPYFRKLPYGIPKFNKLPLKSPGVAAHPFGGGIRQQIPLVEPQTLRP